ncbi:MAG: class I tRNA ligase family protein, partial [Phormidesmis sp.]
GILKLLHPFMPHITEELWHTLTGVGEEDCLALQSYPVAEAAQADPALEQQFDLLIDVIRTIRNLRAEAGVKPSAKIEAILKTDSASELGVLNATRPYIEAMARLETLEILKTDLAPALAAVAKTLSIAEAADIVETTPPNGPSGLGTAISQFLEQPARYFNGFFSSYRKPALSVAIVLGTAVTYKVLDSMLDTLDGLGLRGVFQLIGLFYTVRFISNRGFKAENRDRVLSELKSAWAEISGNDDTNIDTNVDSGAAELAGSPSASSTSVSVQMTPPSVTPADIIRADSNQPLARGAVGDRKMFAGVTGTVQVLIPLTGVIDVDALRAKLEKDLVKAEGEIKSFTGRLSNKGFVDQAPGAVVQGARDALAESEKQATLIRERLAML